MNWKSHSQRTDQSEREARKEKKTSGAAHLWQRLILGGLCILLCMGFIFRVYIKTLIWLPVDLHSGLKADYSADGLVPPWHAIRFELIRDAIHDQFFIGQTGDDSQTDHYATLVSELQTPVATVTPLHPVTQQPTSTPTQTATSLPTTAAVTQSTASTATATTAATQLSDTATPVLTQVFTTAIPRPTSTRPPKPTSTKKPSPTPVLPTQPAPTQPPPTATKPPAPTKVPPTAPPPPTRPPYPWPTINPYP